MRLISSIVFTVLFFSILAAFPALAATIHVPADQPTIQAGIDASVGGDIVLVAPGIYVENINFIGKAITVRSESDPEETVIDGDQTWSVVTFISGETGEGVIDGFTIRNGDTDKGGGIYCSGTSPTITNCTILENTADSYGGGIYCKESSPIITNCTIEQNAAHSGGGIHCYLNSSPMITDCAILNNEVSSHGGGIYCRRNSSPTIANCTITGNAAASGGGILCMQSFPSITNCILWANLSPEGPEIALKSNATLLVSHCDVKRGESAVYVGPGTTLNWGEGNIDADPLFVTPWNYHLRPDSPCIDTGTDAGVYTDIDGQPRPWGAGFDMGADEFSTDPCSVIASSGNQFVAFYLLPVLALIFFKRRFLQR